MSNVKEHLDLPGYTILDDDGIDGFTLDHSTISFNPAVEVNLGTLMFFHQAYSRRSFREKYDYGFTDVMTAHIFMYWESCVRNIEDMKAANCEECTFILNHIVNDSSPEVVAKGIKDVKKNIIEEKCVRITFQMKHYDIPDRFDYGYKKFEIYGVWDEKTKRFIGVRNPSQKSGVTAALNKIKSAESPEDVFKNILIGRSHSWTIRAGITTYGKHGLMMYSPINLDHLVYQPNHDILYHVSSLGANIYVPKIEITTTRIKFGTRTLEGHEPSRIQSLVYKQRDGWTGTLAKQGHVEVTAEEVIDDFLNFLRGEHTNKVLEKTLKVVHTENEFYFVEEQSNIDSDKACIIVQIQKGKPVIVGYIGIFIHQLKAQATTLPNIAGLDEVTKRIALMYQLELA